MVAKNNYFWSREYKDLDFIANGDVARVVKVRNTREMYGFRFADVALYFPDYDVENRNHKNYPGYLDVRCSFLNYGNE